MRDKTHDAMLNAAQAFDVTFVVGVRAKGTWFATAVRPNHDPIEYDAATPAQAVRDVIRGLEQRVAERAATLERELAQAKAMMDRHKP